MNICMLKDMRIVNTIGILQFEEGNQDTKALVKSFEIAMLAIKGEDNLVTQDFTKVTHVEEMLCLCIDQLPKHLDRIK